MFNSEWYLQQIFEIRQLPYKPGCGWLPNDWMYEDGLRRGCARWPAAHWNCRVTATPWA